MARLVDSVDFHAAAWQRAFNQFGHQVTFQKARQQIGKGGDQLIPTLLSDANQRDHGKAIEAWRSEFFKDSYLPLVKPFSGVPDLLQTLRRKGLRVAVASSAKKSELETYLAIAGITGLVDETISSDDADRSKPAPDVFAASLKRPCLPGESVMAVGDSPYDAQAAGKIGIRTTGVLCGGFTGDDLLHAGCVAI